MELGREGALCPWAAVVWRRVISLKWGERSGWGKALPFMYHRLVVRELEKVRFFVQKKNERPALYRNRSP